PSDVLAGVQSQVKASQARSHEGRSSPTRERVVGAIRSGLREVIRISERELQNDRPFADYGIDSILGVRFIEHFRDTLHMPLHTGGEMVCPASRRLCDYTQATYQAHGASFDRVADAAKLSQGSAERVVAQGAIEGQPGFPAVQRTAQRVGLAGSDDIAVIG